VIVGGRRSRSPTSAASSTRPRTAARTPRARSPRDPRGCEADVFGAWLDVRRHDGVCLTNPTCTSRRTKSRSSKRRSAYESDARLQ
jgi:hypothetical protein